MRDCENCIRNIPGQGCTSWDCEYINRLEAIETYERSQWIPVSERLPGPFENPVLVSGYMSYVSVGWWNGKEFETATRLPHVDVVAWKPMPEPWEGE